MHHALTSVRKVAALIPCCPQCGSARYQAGVVPKSLHCRDCGEDIFAAYVIQNPEPRFLALSLALGASGLVAAFGLFVMSVQAQAG